MLLEATDFGDVSKFKKIVIAPGRFNPPHRGHKLMIDSLIELGEKLDAEPVVIIADSKKYGPRNPLTGDIRKKYLSKMFPGVRIEISRNPYDAVHEMAQKNKELPVGGVTGSDRGAAYAKMVKKLFGTKFQTKILHRDPDSKDIAGVSSTKARQAAENDDVVKFRALTGLEDNEARALMKQLAKGMK